MTHPDPGERNYEESRRGEENAMISVSGPDSESSRSDNGVRSILGDYGENTIAACRWLRFAFPHLFIASVRERGVRTGMSRTF